MITEPLEPPACAFVATLIDTPFQQLHIPENPSGFIIYVTDILAILTINTGVYNVDLDTDSWTLRNDLHPICRFSSIAPVDGKSFQDWLRANLDKEVERASHDLDPSVIQTRRRM